MLTYKKACVRQKVKPAVKRHLIKIVCSDEKRQLTGAESGIHKKRNVWRKMNTFRQFFADRNKILLTSLS